MVLLSDILPSGFECGVLKGGVEPGSTVAIVGAGPIGLATLLTAQLYSPSQIVMIDPDECRLQVAKQLGATHVISDVGELAIATVKSLTTDNGADTVVEAVGIPQSFLLCQDLVAPGGTIANIGVHGQKVDLHLERLWSHNITITTRLVDTTSTPMLLKNVMAHRFDPRRLITHSFPLDQIEQAYDIFRRAAETKAIKVVLNA
jgi:alcohol dehydrogenase